MYRCGNLKCPKFFSPADLKLWKKFESSRFGIGEAEKSIWFGWTFYRQATPDGVGAGTPNRVIARLFCLHKTGVFPLLAA